jgi:proteasome lid subunit RPN8/RPN11
MIRIDDRLLERIREHGALAYPYECCGALLGRAVETNRDVVDLLSLDNRRDGQAARRRFLVTAEDHLRIERVARERELEIVGFYHSHPDHPARPSDFDREHALPWYSYVILQVTDGVPGEIACWRLADDRSHFDGQTIVASPVKHLIRR